MGQPLRRCDKEYRSRANEASGLYKSIAMSSLQIVVRCTTWMVANGRNEDHDAGKDDQNEEEE